MPATSVSEIKMASRVDPGDDHINSEFVEGINFPFDYRFGDDSGSAMEIAII
jgi:hypothetical protein